MTQLHSTEISAGERFEFGANWSRFLNILDDERIKLAEESLCKMLGVNNLIGKRFLDAGSGSGLFSLAARRLGATVHSFDFDPQSVACTRALKTKYFPDDDSWKIEEASVLNKVFLTQLGVFDVVYSWGVLHHTGDMWDALANIDYLVAEKGQLFIAIYNDQGWISHYWLYVKKYYVRSLALSWLIIIIHWPYLFGLRYIVRALSRRLKIERGMSLWYDMIDWLGGYPFEIAKPEEIFNFFYTKKYQLSALKTCGGRMGCNEFVFIKQS